MKTKLLLLFIILNITNASSQEKRIIIGQPKALNVGVYDGSRVPKNKFKVYHDEEAEKEFEKLLLKDAKLRNEFVEDLVDEDGKSYTIREREIYTLYPDLNIVIEGGGHGFISVFDFKNRKRLNIDPATYAYSPSRKWRFGGLNSDGMHYFLEEKVNGEYVLVENLGYMSDEYTGFYWNDDKTIFFLRERTRDDGSSYWMAYSFKIGYETKK